MEKVRWEVQIRKGRKGWYWRVVSKYNGKVVCHSETYVNRFSCTKTAQRIAEDLNRSILVER